MKKDFFRYVKPGVLISFILLLGGGIYLGNTYLSSTIGTSLSIATVIASTFLVIDQYLWNYPILKWLYWVPDMSGRYEGQIKYLNPITESQEQKSCAVEIFQTGSRLKVNCYFQHEYRSEDTSSKSLVEQIVKNDDDTYEIVFTYRNGGNQNGFSPHAGTTILKFIDNNSGKDLKGYYYTNRDPQTKGTLEVKQVSRQLKNDF